MTDAWKRLHEIVGEATPEDRRGMIARRMAVKGGVPSGMRRISPGTDTGASGYSSGAARSNAASSGRPSDMGQMSVKNVNPAEVVKQALVAAGPDGASWGDIARAIHTLHYGDRPFDPKQALRSIKTMKSSSRFDLDQFLSQNATQDPTTQRWTLK